MVNKLIFWFKNKIKIKNLYGILISRGGARAPKDHPLATALQKPPTGK